MFLSIIILSFSMVFLPSAYSATKLLEDGSIRASITHPEGVVRGSNFNIAILTENTGVSDRFNVTLKMALPEKNFNTDDKLEGFYERIAKKSSYGKTVTIHSFPNSTLGQHFINVDLSHSSGSSDYFSSVALPITIREEPKLVISTDVQESIYSNAEFPFIVKIESQGSDIQDVTIKIIPPEIITFRGQTQHTFSSIDRDTQISLRSELVTASAEEIGYEHYISFQITVDYTDEAGTHRSASETVSVLLRPKTFFEFGAEGGFWIGDFYFTPTISLGTFIGIPGGFIAFYKWYKRRIKKADRAPLSYYTPS